MATSYTAKFSSACGPTAPCVFDTATSQPTGAVNSEIGLPTFRPVTDGTAIPNTTYIGGAAQVVLAEITGDPNA